MRSWWERHGRQAGARCGKGDMAAHRDKEEVEAGLCRGVTVARGSR